MKSGNFYSVVHDPIGFFTVRGDVVVVIGIYHASRDEIDPTEFLAE